MTAPATEQVREARERLRKDCEHWDNPKSPEGLLAADIRTVLDALDDLQGRKDRREHTLNAIADLKAKHAAPTAERDFTKPDPNCKACHGEGSFWEDVAGDGRGSMQVSCDCFDDGTAD